MDFTTNRDCCICAGAMETVVDLPRLPLTGVYSAQGEIPDFPSFDQAFMLCPRCGHGQALNVIDPGLLYGRDYGYRTSTSESASRGVVFFADYLEKLFQGRLFQRVLEFGCSDTVLLRTLRSRAQRLLGVDPVLRGRESEFSDERITVVGDWIQNVDVARMLEGNPDLVVSQHTLEHLPDPKAVLEKLISSADESTMFLFEFPCLDPLLDQFRFDHIFHQHAQYFSVQSFCCLLDEVGAEMLDYTVNHTHWGALLIAFRKRSKGPQRNDVAQRGTFPQKTVAAIRGRWSLFQRQMSAASEVIATADSNLLYGYGAADLLPVLGYHLETRFTEFRAILDDNPSKDGMGYVNLPVRIQAPASVNFEEIVICLTALDNRRPIIKKLVDRKPRQIINPHCVI